VAPGADEEDGLHRLDANHPGGQGAPGRGSRNATRSQRAISQPFDLLSRTQSGEPRNAPVMRAVEGPPKISVHAAPRGVGRNAPGPSRCSRRQADAGAGTDPAGLSPHRRVKVRGAVAGSARKTILSEMLPADAAAGNAAHAAATRISPVRRIEGRIRRDPSSRLAAWL
jgi:hypothetical protein